MKYPLLILTIIHGLIHIIGFIKAFKLAEVSQLNQPISKTTGLLWLLLTILFLTAGAMVYLKKESWWLLAFPAVVLSQYVIIQSWSDAKFGTIANIIILIFAIITFAKQQFYESFKKDAASMLRVEKHNSIGLLTENDITFLPEPVKNYIRLTGSLGKPRVNNFKVTINGVIRKNNNSPWMPFTSEQYNFIENPTRLFFMYAKMKGLPVSGYHKYKNGQAFMNIRLLSLFRVQYQDGYEMSVAETVTFFNDMCFMAPATLIDKRIQWLETEGNKVKAQFTNNNLSITAWLHFNKQGELVNFVSDDRYAAADDGSMKKVKWSTPAKEYKLNAGIWQSGYADAVYHYPDKDLCYGNFFIRQIEYNCTKLS